MTYQNLEDENEKCIIKCVIYQIISHVLLCCLFWHVGHVPVESAYKYMNVFNGINEWMEILYLMMRLVY